MAHAPAREEAGRAPRGRFPRLLWLLPAVAAVAVYAPYLGNPLLHDDSALIVGNGWLSHDAGARTVFAHDYWQGTAMAGSDLYRPFTILSLAWNLRAGGGPVGLRAVNLALHVGVAYLAAWMLLAVSGAAGGRDARAAFAAWSAAILFAVHPLGSETVLWVAGRAEMLSAAFGLAAFTLFVRLAGREDAGWDRVAPSAFLFFLALGSKESAASWLLVACVWVLLFRRSIRAPGRILAMRAAAYLAAFAGFLALRGSAVGWGTRPPLFVDNPLVDAGGATRIANAVLLLGLYAFRMVWPRTLSVDWGYDQLPVIRLLPWAAAGATALAAAWAAVGLRLGRRSPRAAFLWLFPAAAFAVTANVAMPIGTNFAERLAYLPLAGAAGLAGLALARVPWPAAAKGAVLAAALAAAGARTFVRGADFASAPSLYEATVRASPRAVKSLASLGQIRMNTLGRPDLAIPPLERAVAIWPDYPRALDLLAEAYARTGRRDEAFEMIRRTREAAAKLRGERGPGDEP